MKNWQIPEDELLYSGHAACQGCGGALAMRLALKALGENSVVTIPACCWTIISGDVLYNALKIPVFHTAFETAAISAAGLKAGLTMRGLKDTTVFAWAGDGGTFDIGIQSISGAAERNEDIIYFVYDNEAYMNTGIQRSSATPWGAWTTTTPVKHPEDKPKKNIDEIIAAHGVPYQATVNIAFPEDFIRKVQKAKGIKGFRFFHIFAPCPPGWKIPSDISIRAARLATQTNVFPLYEIEHGKNYRVSYMPPKKVPVSEYLKIQGRFRHLKEEDVEFIQKMVNENFDSLLKKHELTHGTLQNIPSPEFYR
ncbi:MAG TPA: thiamine pyrophosphate-dependent enzyme [Candidatus Hydrothermia bacterium]|nr:pyruvate synthase subunit beta [Candidatus Hydrothermae bacterium]MDD3649305.1 thiamine pyrophosphate-dependent enzyme [Candidatus Hydrothermia bacterium]HOK22720.1 thiamine pyrophosphate-dependent enzyme [Candidatus Hydrothermia bacterium]HOL23429.1 thiamine pyrophosphate-dependent enzyme [Candidatus Hydrothermia bacterium]HOP32444.1 thiamine pyrophosphate-dependent enzyme [Candidatus Hydrothermia bacterium]